MTAQFDLTDDQREIQDLARKFTAQAITPHAAEWDEQHIFPRDTVKAAAELGFGSIYVSEASGGIGLGRLEAALIMEAMAYGCPSTSAFISIHNMAAWMIDTYGSEVVKTEYLPSMVTCERIGSYCLTEPGSGSDAAALKTKAVRDGDHYVVTGSKAFISGGGENEIYVVMVRTGVDGPKGISCLVIEKDMPGVSFGGYEKKLGWHSQPTAQVNFDGVRVPAVNLVGAEGQGFSIAMSGLDGGRLNIGACSLGGAQRCIDEAQRYTTDRRQFGQRIIDFQNTQFALADMATELEAARALLYMAAAKVSAGAHDKTKFAAMAKRLATDTGSSVVDRALQMFGGYGYLQDYPIERFWRDLRVHRILEGTNEIMRMIVAREMMKQVSDYETILVEQRGAVTLLTLNRPQALNALNSQVLADMVAAARAYDADPEQRCMVVTGSEKAFAAGADIKQMQAMGFAEAYGDNFFAGWEDFTRTRKPIVAAVAGFALGGGCEVAMMCDFILAADTAKFGQPEIKLGVAPGMGGSQRLTRAVGKAKAMEMCLTGRMMGADEAERAGLVSRVVPAAELIDEAIKVATAIAAMPPLAAIANKEMVNAAFETGLAQGIVFERRLFDGLCATEDKAEGMTAFVEKRPGVWAGR